MPSQPGAEPAVTRPTLSPEELAPHFSQLEILECLGRGGMGVVYKARQKSLNRLVALKLLAPERGNDAGFAERFQKEAHALAKLNHPAIVTVYDFGQAGGYYYLLMEFVDGMNLRQLLQSGRIEAREALAIVPQICDALQYAHDAGIVHRDIKPENILLDRRGHVKVADFGLAKLVGHAESNPDETPAGVAMMSEAGKVIGTPQYMAPEQTDHPASVDHRADIYSLGVVFYQMLTGELPKGDFTPPSKKVVLDVRLDEVVLRALEKRPELRYQQVSDVKTMVESIVANPEKSDVRSQKTECDSRDSKKFSLGRVLTGCAVFGVLMGVREEFDDIWIRSLIAGLAAVSGFLLAVSHRWFAANDNAPAAQDNAPRFCRTAIMGACWGLLFFISFILYIILHTAHAVRPGEPAPSGPGPGVWLMMAVMWFGFAAPLGTTILGWVAFSQIRRSGGRLYGKWLALLDGLLFPVLLVLAIVVSLISYAFYRADKVARRESLNAETSHQRSASAFARGMIQVKCLTQSDAQYVADNITSLMVNKFTMDVSKSLVFKTESGFITELQITVSDPVSRQIITSGKPIGAWSDIDQAIQRILTSQGKSFKVVVKHVVLDGFDQYISSQVLQEFDWQKMETSGRPLGGVRVTIDGSIALKMENVSNTPRLTPILKLDWPDISATKYTITGEVKYENVQGTGYLELWSHFAQAGQYFTRTLDVPGSGPMAVISGSSGWRPFSLPFDRSGTTNAISKLEVNLYLPAKGVVYLRLVALAQTVNKNQAIMPFTTDMLAETFNHTVVNDIIQKKIDVSRWGDRGKAFQYLKIGMTKAEVVNLLGAPDEYPKDKPDILQYSPNDHFSGGDTGPDWALVLELKSGRIKDIRFSKWVFGPPPG